MTDMTAKLRVEGPLTIARLNKVARYDAEVGGFFAVVRRGKIKVGAPLGHIRDDGYVIIMIDGHEYLAHRLVRFLFDGEWPPADVDHWDTDPSNNREWNCRHASRSQNIGNSRRRVDNTSGFKGVAWHSRAGRWRAEICVRKQRRYLGLFDRPEDAYAAYLAAARDAFGAFANGGTIGGQGNG